MADDSAVSASAKGATFLILLQVGSRAVTFALNQILLRFLSPALLGVSVQLELFATSTLYFARESFRVAAQRRSGGGVQAAVNLSYLAVAIGPPIGLLLAILYLQTELPNVTYLSAALWAHFLAALVELLSEPAYVAVEQSMLYKIRASAEATAIVAKTVATAGTAFWSSYAGVDVGVLPFAAGELAWAIVLTVVYLARTSPIAGKERFSLLPQKMASSDEDHYVFSLFYQPLLSLSFSLYVQTGIKYLLTQGDTILITRLASLEDQGMYALSANYGGLIARMLFRPIEDSSRNLFAKLCATPSPDKDKDVVGKKVDKHEHGEATNSIRQAGSILKDILHVYQLVSLVAFALGPTAAPILLRLVAGARWSNTGAGEVLGTYCYYIPLLAINGVTEAFVAATASTSDLQRQSLWMGAFFAGFAGSAYVFLQVFGWGAKGLVFANCVNSASRILFNVHFVRAFFVRHDLNFNIADTLPNTLAIAITPLVPYLFQSAQKLSILQKYGLLGDLLCTAGIGGGFALFIAVVERRFLLGCYRRFRS